jgi:hypothetical protein
VISAIAEFSRLRRAATIEINRLRGVVEEAEDDLGIIAQNVRRIEVRLYGVAVAPNEPLYLDDLLKDRNV